MNYPKQAWQEKWDAPAVALPSAPSRFFPVPGPDRSIAVVIATHGRPAVVADLVAILPRQTLPPSHIFVVGATAGDVAGIADATGPVTVRVGRRGSSLQRNDALAIAGDRFAYIVFFDDDFVPSRFWLERMVATFEQRPDLDGLTGEVLADGATGAGVPMADARALVEARDELPAVLPRIVTNVDYGANSGCNMAFRASAIRDLRFDERLPAYAWLEDADFRARAAPSARFARAASLWGVHLGHKQGRSRGLPLGYSQIANAAYLAAKGTVPRRYLLRLAARNLVSNFVHSFRPEPFVDRRGRLQGNLLALFDLVRGRAAPERILSL